MYSHPHFNRLSSCLAYRTPSCLDQPPCKHATSELSVACRTDAEWNNVLLLVSQDVCTCCNVQSCADSEGAEDVPRLLLKEIRKFCPVLEEGPELVVAYPGHDDRHRCPAEACGKPLQRPFLGMLGLQVARARTANEAVSSAKSRGANLGAC